MNGEIEHVRKEIGSKDDQLAQTSRLLDEKSSELNSKLAELDEKLKNTEQQLVRISS